MGRENVKTPAGTFEDCLKIEYRTETEVAAVPSPETGSDPPGESITTLWVAPNIGIVKFHQKAEDIFLKTISTTMPPEVGVLPTVRPPEIKLGIKEV